MNYFLNSGSWNCTIYGRYMKIYYSCEFDSGNDLFDSAMTWINEKCVCLSLQVVVVVRSWFGRVGGAVVVRLLYR